MIFYVFTSLMGTYQRWSLQNTTNNKNSYIFCLSLYYWILCAWIYVMLYDPVSRYWKKSISNYFIFIYVYYCRLYWLNVYNEGILFEYQKMRTIFNVLYNWFMISRFVTWKVNVNGLFRVLIRKYSNRTCKIVNWINCSHWYVPVRFAFSFIV